MKKRTVPCETDGCECIVALSDPLGSGHCNEYIDQLCGLVALPYGRSVFPIISAGSVDVMPRPVQQWHHAARTTHRHDDQR